MHPIERLLEIMARLRDPTAGCPWDLEQSFETIAPYTIEEAYEVDDAIRRGDLEALREELGDLLLQVVFHAQLAGERGCFDFADVVASICDKLVRRHPHVFAEPEAKSTEEQLVAWEEHKAVERKQKSGNDGALDGVALGLPALLRAQKLQRRAARAGLAGGAPLGLAWQAFRAALAGSDPARLVGRLGDLLFSVSDAAGRAGADAERALRDANARFEEERRS